MKNILEFYFTLFVPLVYAINLVAISTSKSMNVSIWLQVTGLCIAFMGIVIWTISYINLGIHFGVLPKTQKIVSSGMYSFFKHPMYFGISYTFFGLSLANQSRLGLIFLLFITTPILAIRAHHEDKKLVT
jgi:protein-S-isoprenylcysteine O-methyltransferase